MSTVAYEPLMIPISANHGIARCVIFAGGLKASPLQSACPASVLNLPLLPGCSTLDLILRRIAETRLDPGPPLPVSVVYGHPVPAPVVSEPSDRLLVSVIPEPGRWRGPAGVLLDLCADLPVDANILVLEGARWFGSPFRNFITDHLLRNADVTIAQSPDRSPAGAYLLRRSALDPVPPAGFLDLKEQLLGRLLSDRRRLFVHTLAAPGGLSLRTLTECLAAARAAAGGPREWNVVDPSAEVDPGAMVVSSIIMARAQIGPGAVVARSIVLQGASVPAGAEVVDAVVQTRGIRPAPGLVRAAGRWRL